MVLNLSSLLLQSCPLTPQCLLPFVTYSLVTCSISACLIVACLHCHLLLQSNHNPHYSLPPDLSCPWSLTYLTSFTAQTLPCTTTWSLICTATCPWKHASACPPDPWCHLHTLPMLLLGSQTSVSPHPPACAGTRYQTWTCCLLQLLLTPQLLMSGRSESDNDSSSPYPGPSPTLLLKSKVSLSLPPVEQRKNMPFWIQVHATIGIYCLPSLIVLELRDMWWNH